VTDLSKQLADKVIVVTGASGYIGSSLVNELSKYSVKLIRISRKKLVPIFGIEDWILDLNESSSWSKIVGESDIIFHLAGNTSIYEAEANPEKSLTSTLFPITNLINSARFLGCTPRVIFASTATVYGITETFPVTELTKPQPITMYDLHKLFAEQQLSMASHNSIISLASLRLANVYGPSLTESKAVDRGVLSKVTKTRFAGGNLKVFGNGSYLRDYVYIDDVVSAFLHAGVTDKAESTFNVASGISTTVKEVFNLISIEVEKITGVTGVTENVSWPKDVNRIEKRNYITSFEKIKSVAGWSPKISLEEGIRRLVKHYSEGYKK